MKFQISKERCLKLAQLGDRHDIAAGALPPVLSSDADAVYQRPEIIALDQMCIDREIDVNAAEDELSAAEEAVAVATKACHAARRKLRDAVLKSHVAAEAYLRAVKAARQNTRVEALQSPPTAG